MTEINKQTKAEEILTDDSFLNENGTIPPCPAHIDEKEYLFAKKIHQALLLQRQKLHSSEKNFIQRRTNQRIKHTVKSQFILRMSSAAAILLIMLTTAAILWKTSQPDILNFASQSAIIPQSGQTKLYFEDHSPVEIRSKESKINYLASNNSIQIDSIQKIQNILNPDDITYHTLVVPFGKRTKITLSDSSVVWINSGSKLIYPSKFKENKREVYLEGEAIFEICHYAQCPFHVLTNNMEVKVLGTIFSLSAYADDSSVSTVLKQGSIELKYKGDMFLGYNKEQIIPGTRAVFCPESKTLHKSIVNPQNFMSWKDGYVILEKRSLGYITKKLSRYYNIPIQIEDQQLANEKFSGYLDLRNTATQVLEIISEVIDISIKTDKEQISISRKPGSEAIQKTNTNT